MDFTHEVIHQLWDNKNGDRIEIGPDRDGLGVFEIRHFDESNTCDDSVLIQYEQIGKIVEILQMIQRGAPQKIPSGPVPR